jgi:hypothetical protein
MSQPHSIERDRLNKNGNDWKRWGPYLSERSWGTVREDYSANGNAWDFLPHDLARSKSYRWGEDGIAGICDRYQIMCFGLGLWNEKDPILKERMFGLTGPEGNHGEDVKEYYYYLDSTPTHSYMKYLYRYTQNEYPYGWLIHENRQRQGKGFEFELIDTNAFDNDRYFDVFVEYAKASAEDMCIQITAHNRGDQPAPLHIMPHLWFRNIWRNQPEKNESKVEIGHDGKGFVSLSAEDGPLNLKSLGIYYALGRRYLYCQGAPSLLFTDNETNAERVFGAGAQSRSPYVKDAFHRHVIHKEPGVLRPENFGTKAAAHYHTVVPAKSSWTVKLRLTQDARRDPFDDFDRIVAARIKEADDFYATVHPPRATADEKLVQRQALAGMLWTKQAYIYDVNQWLNGDDPAHKPPASRNNIRNGHWRHLNSRRVLSMPDKWEYPWFAAWDLAFHTIPLALVDLEFAKEQLWLLMFEQFMHPNGQIPAYEWEFSDLNPPVQGFAALKLFQLEKRLTGKPDFKYLERVFHKLILNFAWWINRTDSEGHNIFEGGFLGLDNISVLDRSEKLPPGWELKQSDATGWMALLCLSLMKMALDLAHHNSVYEGLATKFFQHFIYVTAAMNRMGNQHFELWDEKDGFFYDVLSRPGEDYEKIRVRSLVGLIPLYAVDAFYEHDIENLKEFKFSLKWFIENRQNLTRKCLTIQKTEHGTRYVLSILGSRRLPRILDRLFSEDEFLSPYGFRSLSKAHKHEPYRLGTSTVNYEPAESDNKIKGGNSNWRGPIWFPTSYLLIESLRKFSEYYPELKVSRKNEPDISLAQAADEVADRMIGIFRRNENGCRPVFGGSTKFQEDPNWRDHVLFYEYFHGDEGAGLGASHQTGWTGLVASLIDEIKRTHHHTETEVLETMNVKRDDTSSTDGI